MEIMFLYVKIVFLFLFTANLYVIDTDTFICNNEKIRLACCDGLEKDQHPFEKVTTAYVRNRLNRAKSIKIQRLKTDKYGRTIAKVYIDNQDLALDLISKG